MSTPKQLEYWQVKLDELVRSGKTYHELARMDYLQHEINDAMRRVQDEQAGAAVTPPTTY